MSISGIKDEYRIGGEFNLSIDDFLAPEVNTSLNFLRKKYYLFPDTGRSAIYVALLTIIRQGGKKEAWLPYYCCKSILLPFRKLGFKVKFYSMGSDLKSPFNLPARLERETFFFIHYFGKKNWVILDYLNKMKKQDKFFVIEDCVQALLNRNLGTYDFIIYSYRKFLPQPDGALLASDYPLKHNLPSADEAFVSLRLIGKLIAGKGEADSFLDLFNQAEKIIDSCIYPREMSCLSYYLLARVDAAEIARIRRANFFYLLELLNAKIAYLRPLFDSLEDDEVPLGLPILADPANRDRLREFLKSQNIYCPVHWILESNEGGNWDSEMELSNSILTLPIDQRLDFSGLDFLAEQITRFFARVDKRAR